MTAQLKDKYVVGTRESQLARLQTDLAINALKKCFPDVQFDLMPITTHGDKVQNKPIAELGDRGVFVKELEEALLRDQVDFVVHSLKDLPTEMPPSLILGGVLGREDPRDVLVTVGLEKLEDLPRNSKIASSSRRRAAQILALRPDIEFVDVRGNIPTRLRKLEDGIADGMVLAAAGLLRLGEEARIAEYFSFDRCTPAVGQGVLGLECRKNDPETIGLLAAINESSMMSIVTAERAFLNEIGGGCSVPVGAVAQFNTSGQLTLDACIASLDGKQVLRASAAGTAQDADSLGRSLARQMLSEGGDRILAGLLESTPAVVPPP